MDTELLFTTVYLILRGYYYLLIFYIILSWVVSRESALYRAVGIFCDPFFRVFRGLLVISGMDFTPMLGLILYQLALAYVLNLY